MNVLVGKNDIQADSTAESSVSHRTLGEKETLSVYGGLVRIWVGKTSERAVGGPFTEYSLKINSGSFSSMKDHQYA